SQSRRLHDVVLCPSSQATVAMYGHRNDGSYVVGMLVNVMAALYPFKHPAMSLQSATESFARNRFHNSISTTRPGSPVRRSLATSQQPSMASRMLARTSSIVSPSETQPGRAGTSAQK